MIYVLILAAGMWFVGRRLRVTVRARWIAVGAIYALVLLALLVLPLVHPVRVALGGTLGEWLVLGGTVVLVIGYRSGLGALRRRARPQAPTTAGDGLFASGELQRYARHIMLRELGGPGQRALKQSKVLVVGAGGLGSPAMLYLAAAGVGTIGVVDDDVVEASNLQRQIMHADERIGMPKVFSAEQAIRGINPFVSVRPFNRRLDADTAGELISEFDLVLDGTDNFDTRYLVNRICAAQGKPLVSAALTQWEGQISLFDPSRGTPCYQCVFPEAPAPGLAPSCAEAGVLGPLPGVVGAMMAVEAVKRIAGAGQTLAGRMMIYDALYGETRTISLSRRPDCPVCGRGADAAPDTGQRSGAS